MSSEPAGDPDTRRRILDAALRLIDQRGGADITLAQVGRAAKVSRQAVYLHFKDRAGLLLALVRHADDRRGLPAAIQRVVGASSGVSALREMAMTQVTMNPGIWRLARLFDGERRHDPAMEQSWQDRLSHRLEGCRAIVARLAAEGDLRRGLDPGVAADLLWVITSLHAWEDLVLVRGWSDDEYLARVTGALSDLLLEPGRRRAAAGA